jgi:hypothetical protein
MEYRSPFKLSVVCGLPAHGSVDRRPSAPDTIEYRTRR